MLALDRQRSAVLIMDFQQEILARLGDQAAPIVANAARLVAAARAAKVPVLYVVVGFRPGYPEVSERNLSFATVVQSGRFTNPTPAETIDAALRPEADEAVVTKHRVSAFAGTDLEMLLRAKNRDTLILSGISTSGVVLSTLRFAADADYRVIVVNDACADTDAEVHRVLMEKVFPRQATVGTTSEVIERL